MRTFLRLDYLYNQALYHNEKASQWGSRAAVGSLIDILAITTRSDVRSEVLKEIERHLTQLAEFENKSGVDGGRLRALINNLSRLRSALSAAGAAYLQPLRDSEFLAAIKHRSAIPGGTCEFDLPDYFFWLNQDAAQPHAGLQRVAGAAAAAVRCRRRSAVAHAPERPQPQGSRRRRHLHHQFRP